tara:strand:- start:597496 stop:598278 length:783 start_codon:yes stop_codon:yes gene_type:complete
MMGFLRILTVAVLAVFIVVLGGGIGTSFAQNGVSAQDGLVLSLADEYVDITTNFSGRQVVVFGINETGGALVVTLNGPESYTIIRQKGQVLGIWANIRAFGFKNVPRYYDYAVNGDEASLAPLSVLRKERVGINSMHYEVRSRADDLETKPFHEALIRQKQHAKHFAYNPQKVTYIGDKLFKVTFDLPADVPTGAYNVKAMSFKGQKKIAEQEAVLQIRQVGFSASLYSYAHGAAFLYGLFVVLFAVFFGYGAHLILAKR